MTPLIASFAKQFLGVALAGIGLIVIFCGFRMQRRRVNKDAELPPSVRDAMGARQGNGPGS